MDPGRPARTKPLLAALATLVVLSAVAPAARADHARSAVGAHTVNATLAASGYDAALGTDACATAKRGTSRYAHGLRLVNGCAAANGDEAIAQYTFTLPSAPRYATIRLQVLGTTTSVPSRLTAAFHADDGTLELPGHVKVTDRTHVWRTIASMPAAGQVDSKRRVRADVLLDATYAGVNNFDLDRVRLQVTEPG